MDQIPANGGQPPSTPRGNQKDPFSPMENPMRPDMTISPQKNGGFRLPKGRNPNKLLKANLFLLDSQQDQKDGASFHRSLTSTSSRLSGMNSPTMTQLSYATSMMNQDSKVIYEERLYQMKNALSRLSGQQQSSFQIDTLIQDVGQTEAPLQNIVKQVKLITHDSRSLKLWVKVAIEAGISEIMSSSVGFELIKILLEKLWQDCISSRCRKQESPPVKLTGNSQESAQIETSQNISSQASAVGENQPVAIAMDSNSDYIRQCQSFSKFFHLTFEVFPLKLNTIDSVIKLLFSPSGIFQCVDDAYVNAPITLMDVLAQRAKLFLLNSQTETLKNKIFQNLVKLEDVNKRARSILDKLGIQRSTTLKRRNSYQNDGNSDTNSRHSGKAQQNAQEQQVEITNQVDKIFLLTLMAFHSLTPETIRQNQRSLRLFVVYNNKWPELVISLNGQMGAENYSLRQCMLALTESYKDQLQEQAEHIYDTTIIRKLPTYLKKVTQVYPQYKNVIEENLIKSFPHKDRPQIVHLLVYQQFAIKLANLLESESKVYKLIIENITNLDVEIKIRIRKGTHLVKISPEAPLQNIYAKIETKEQYGHKMNLRSADEREIKVELMLLAFMNTIDHKIAQMNRGGKRMIQKFSEFFMNVCCEKILNVSQSNFVQYLPLYIILKSKAHFSKIDLKQHSLDKSSCCEILFSTCFISELIQRSFPAGKQVSKKSLCLENRMRAWNHLSSLLAQKDLLDECILVKSLVLIVDHFERSSQQYQLNKQLDGFYSEIQQDRPQQPSADMLIYQKQFNHCFVQGMLQILTAQHQILTLHESQEETKGRKTILQKVIRMVFKQGFNTGGLLMCSQTIICDFLKEYELCTGIQSYIYKDKYQMLLKILQQQSHELTNSSKIKIFEKLNRFMPFDNYEHMHLKKLKNQLVNAEKAVTLRTSSRSAQTSAQQSSNISMRSYSPPAETKKEDEPESSFVLNVPQKNEANPQQNPEEEVKMPTPEQPVQDCKKPMQITQFTTNILTHENLQIIQNRDRNKFARSAAERHQRQRIFPNGEENTEHVSECDTIMSITNIPKPIERLDKQESSQSLLLSIQSSLEQKQYDKFKKKQHISKCQQSKTEDLRQQNMKYNQK